MDRQRGIATGWIYLIGIIVLLTILTGIGRAIYNAGAESIKVEWAAANEKQRKAEADKGNAASTNLETGNAQARVVYRTITKTVDKIVTRVEYQRVCFDADGLQIASAALIGKSADPGKPDKPVPRPDPAR